MPDNALAASTHSDSSSGRRTSAPLHRLPTRAVEPPFDDDTGTGSGSCTGDENHAAPDSVQGTLALAFALSSGLSAIPDLPAVSRLDHAPRRLTLVPPLPAVPDKQSRSPRTAPETPAGTPETPARATGSTPGTAAVTASDDIAVSRPGKRAGRRRAAREVEPDDFGPQRTPRALLPEPRPWAGRLVQAIVEVTSGARPIGQLVRWTTTEVYESVHRRTAHLASVDHLPRRIGAIVRSVHIDEPGDGIAEVCAVIQHGGRCRAIALRLEGVDGRWQCTALQVG